MRVVVKCAPANSSGVLWIGRELIVNTGVTVPESAVIGFDAAADRELGYTVTEAGITVVG